MELTTNNSTLNQGEQGQNNTGTEDTNPQQTFTREEVEALIQKESDKRVSQALATAERKNQAKLREAEKLAQMNESERYEFELQKREQAIAEKEHQLLLAENRAEASKILAEKGLSQSFLDFVISETADEMNEKISTIDRAFKTSVKLEVEKRLGSSTPKSATTPVGNITKEQFSKLTLSQLQELKNNDRELYNQLIN